MNQRFLMWGLTSIAFIVTLAISSWQEGLWQAETPAPAHSARTNPFAASDEPGEPPEPPARPLAPMQIAPAPPPQAVAAVTPQPPPQAAPDETPPAQEPTQPSAQELDERDFGDHRDREAEHSSRTR